MLHVVLPSQLESYTSGLRELELEFQDPSHTNLSLVNVIQELDRRFPGLKFRLVDEQGQIRRHIAIFVGENLVRVLDHPLSGSERIQIVGALSGG
jgi:sulfur-carrier protein